MGTRARQWAVGLLGGSVCVAMLALGLWQMRVFEDKEFASAAARAALPPVPLAELLGPSGDDWGAAYGRAVSVQGRYVPSQQVAVVDADGTVRVLSAFLLDDGRVLPVVRGTVARADGTLRQPPADRGTASGVLLPSEAAPDHTAAPGTLASVRLPQLAQAWPQQLLPGFITLPGSESVAQGLSPASVRLPTGDGSIQNIGYALQWWVFAAFGAFMTVRFVRAIGRRGTLGTLSDEEDE
jgi:cytochrome oxidase assembly protein ShyY1